MIYMTKSERNDHHEHAMWPLLVHTPAELSPVVSSNKSPNGILQPAEADLGSRISQNPAHHPRAPDLLSSEGAGGAGTCSYGQASWPQLRLRSMMTRTQASGSLIMPLCLVGDDRPQ
jgi:hypothetical protein